MKRGNVVEDQRPDNATANASDTQEDVRAAQRKLKSVEKSIEYSAQIADTIHRLANWLSGKR
jgi:hypothetical protein